MADGRLIVPPLSQGPPTCITPPSVPKAIGVPTPEFLEALWRLRLELAIFKLERRAVRTRIVVLSRARGFDSDANMRSFTF